jgi:hypothetical protein
VLSKDLVRAIEYDAAGWEVKYKETARGGLAVNVIVKDASSVRIARTVCSSWKMACSWTPCIEVAELASAVVRCARVR